MARLRQKQKGANWFLDYRDVDGKRYRIDTGTKDRKVASLWVKRVEELTSQARLGIIDKVGRIDADVLAGRKKQSVAMRLSQFKSKIAERYEFDLGLAVNSIGISQLAIESFKGVVGNKLISEITDDDVIAWKRRLMRDKKAKATQSMWHRALRAAFNRAIKWEWGIERNPFAIVEIIKTKAEDSKKKPLTFEEVRTLLAQIEDDLDIQFGNYIRFLLYTGCRRNEILFLRWEHIDLENMALTVYQQKTGGKKLVLPINKALKRVIDNMAQKRHGYVFQTHSNSRGVKYKEVPWTEDYPTRRFKHYAVKCGITGVSLHSLRGTYATYLRTKGVPLDIVQRLLGHASSRTTETHYDFTNVLHFRQQADMVDFEDGPPETE